MPSKTPEASSHNGRRGPQSEIRQKVGIPQKVAKEFNRADTGTKRLSQAMKKGK